VVTTPNKLQDEIDFLEGTSKPRRKFYLLVSTAVNRIACKISNLFKNVYIIACGDQRSNQPDTFIIDPTSTYCGRLIWEWDQLPPDQLPSGHRLVLDRCATVLETVVTAARNYIEKSTPYLTLASSTRISKESVEKVEQTLIPPEDQAASSRKPGSVNKTASRDSWISKLKVILETVFGLTAHVKVWFNNAGIFIPGTPGFRVAAGYSPAAEEARSRPYVAGKLRYHLTWEQVLDYVRRKLSSIWDKVCSAVARIWERIKSLGHRLRQFNSSGDGYMPLEPLARVRMDIR
jgi:hypothetical protein